MAKKKPTSERKPKGWKPTRVIKLDATPERTARVFFSNVKAPDSSRRKPGRKSPRPSGRLASFAYKPLNFAQLHSG